MKKYPLIIDTGPTLLVYRSFWTFRPIELDKEQLYQIMKNPYKKF